MNLDTTFNILSFLFTVLAFFIAWKEYNDYKMESKKARKKDREYNLKIRFNEDTKNLKIIVSNINNSLYGKPEDFTDNIYQLLKELSIFTSNVNSFEKRIRSNKEYFSEESIRLMRHIPDYTSDILTVLQYSNKDESKDINTAIITRVIKGLFNDLNLNYITYNQTRD